MIGDVTTTSMVHLFASKGKRWKRLRYIANPAFSTFNLKRVKKFIYYSSLMSQLIVYILID